MSANGGLWAGSASVVVNPPIGAPMQGYDVRHASAIGDPITASALAVGSDSIDWLLLDVDAIGLDRSFVRRIRRTVARRLRMTPTAITIGCSHTHSGGATLARLGPVAADAAYLRFLSEQLTVVAERAASDRRPVRWRFGVTSLAENVNRRLMVNGRVELGVNPAGPVDHRLRVLRLDPDQGSVPSALLVHYSCHATTSGAGLEASADWPGAMRDYVRGFYAQHGEPPGVHFVQGCSGDVTHRIGRDRDAWPEHFGQETVLQARLLGRRAGEAAVAASEGAAEFGVETVQAGSCAVELPYLGNRGSERTEVQVVRIGRSHGSAGLRNEALWLVGLPGEPFTQYDPRFASAFANRFGASPDRLLVCGYTNDCVGYLCTEEALRQGGYEAALAHRVYHRPAPFGDRTEALLLDRALAAAESLAQPGGGPGPVNHSLKAFVSRIMALRF